MTAQARLLGGRYQVGELLGYGGMAEVHRGRDLRLGRDVAIKTLRLDLARDDTFQLRFRREAQNAASLNHPAIVAVYDTGDERGPNGEELPYIVMEYVNGRTLKEVLAAEGPLMPRRALEITADICAALEFSHRHGIIHRDIKPGNVMLTQAGQVKVMDFGIARALASGASTMTQTSAVIGTAQYLSPEQARGEAVDARSDVYATGCVIFELLCGHPPFTGDNPVSVAYQHVREDAPAPSLTNRDVTPDVDAVTLKALAKNPLNRYQSAGEMRADLLRAASGRPVMATPVMREDDRTAIVNAAPQRRVTPPPRRRDSRGTIVAVALLSVLILGVIAGGFYLLSNQTVAVPNLSGKSQAEAEQALRDKGLSGSQYTVSNSKCAKNTVVEQKIEAGREVSANTVVQYGLCVGPGQATVPRVIGLSKADASQQMESAGLKVKFVDADSEKPADTVIKADPDQGAQVQANSTVTLTISKGNMKVVPSVLGQTQESAVQSLRDAGFEVRVVPVNTASLDEAGKVIDQNPKEKAAIKGSAVTIFVGKASPPPSSSPPTPVPSSPQPSAGD